MSTEPAVDQAETSSLQPEMDENTMPQTLRRSRTSNIARTPWGRDSLFVSMSTVKRRMTFSRCSFST